MDNYIDNRKERCLVNFLANHNGNCEYRLINNLPVYFSTIWRIFKKTFCPTFSSIIWTTIRFWPAFAFSYSVPIVESPLVSTVVPGAADYPFTTAYGGALSEAITGTATSFFIQTKDSMGNNKTTDFEDVDPTFLLTVILTGGDDDNTVYYADIFLLWFLVCLWKMKLIVCEFLVFYSWRC